MDDEIKEEMTEKMTAEMTETKKGMWALLQGVLLSPVEAFEELLARPEGARLWARRPNFLAAAFLITGVSLALSLAMIPKMQEYMLWTLEHTPNLPPEQLAAGRPMIGIIAVVSSIAGGLFVPWLYWLVIAGLLKLYDTLFAGKAASFGALFAVAVYGYLPILLGTIIAGLIMFFTPVENVPWISVSLAALLPARKTYFYFFLTRCNPFTWWSITLWSIGWARAARVKPAGALIYLFGIWLALSLATAAYILSRAGAIPG